jgi:hypothetical protein
VRICRRLAREKALDLEAVEFYIRSAMLGAGAAVLEQWLQGVGVGRQAHRRRCACPRSYRPMESRGGRAKTLRTLVGAVRFARSRYVCAACGAVEFPGDELLGVTGTGFSPGLRRLMVRAGSRESFEEAAEDLYIYGGIKVDSKDIERVAENTGRRIDDWMQRQGSAALLAAQGPSVPDEPIAILYIELDGTGVPVRRSETAGRKGKGADGQARTREVKLGAVFTQSALDKEGRPVRDPDSTTYVGAIESSADFGYRLHAEAVRRGLKRAKRVVVLSDGADYNATIVGEHFPGALHILDIFHADERLSDFIKDTTAQAGQGPLHQECRALLDEGQVEDLIERMRSALPRHGARRKEGLGRIQYFDERKELMRYGEFRRQGLFVGSGVIEAGCKTVIAKRLKQSGMFWTVPGANAIIAARCCLYSGRFEQFWEDTGS